MDHKDRQDNYIYAHTKHILYYKEIHDGNYLYTLLLKPHKCKVRHRKAWSDVRRDSCSGSYSLDNTTEASEQFEYENV